MHRSCTIYKQKQPKTVLNKYVGGFLAERTTLMDFFTGESNIMDLNFS